MSVWKVGGVENFSPAKIIFLIINKLLYSYKFYTMWKIKDQWIHWILKKRVICEHNLLIYQNIFGIQNVWNKYSILCAVKYNRKDFVNMQRIFWKGRFYAIYGKPLKACVNTSLVFSDHTLQYWFIKGLFWKYSVWIRHFDNLLLAHVWPEYQDIVVKTIGDTLYFHWWI